MDQRQTFQTACSISRSPARSKSRLIFLGALRNCVAESAHTPFPSQSIKHAAYLLQEGVARVACGVVDRDYCGRRRIKESLNLAHLSIA